MKWKTWTSLLAVILVAASTQASALGINLIQRNYRGNMTATDRFWYYKTAGGAPLPDGGGIYPLLEWDFHRTENYPVVHARTEEVKVDLILQNNQMFAEAVGQLVVTGARLRIPPSFTNSSTTYLTLTAQVNSGVITIPEMGGTGLVTFTLTGIPNYVTRGYLEIDAKFMSGAGPIWNTGGFAPWELLYVTDGRRPAGTLQAVPWTDLLDYTCSWAQGKTGFTDVANYVTRGLFWDGPWVYDYTDPMFWFEKINNVSGKYNLKHALSGSQVSMDCQDVAGFNNLAMRSLGHEFEFIRLRPDPEIGFITNPLCPMGSDATVDAHPVTGLPTYVRYGFAFHQVMRNGTNVWDAAAAQRFHWLGYVYREPPSDWHLSGYWQDISSSGVFGLAYSYTSFTVPTNVEGTSQPMSISDYTQEIPTW